MLTVRRPGVHNPWSANGFDLARGTILNNTENLPDKKLTIVDRGIGWSRDVAVNNFMFLNKANKQKDCLKIVDVFYGQPHTHNIFGKCIDFTVDPYTYVSQ